MIVWYRYLPGAPPTDAIPYASTYYATVAVEAALLAELDRLQREYRDRGSRDLPGQADERHAVWSTWDSVRHALDVHRSSAAHTEVERTKAHHIVDYWLSTGVLVRGAP